MKFEISIRKSKNYNFCRVKREAFNIDNQLSETQVFNLLLLNSESRLSSSSRLPKFLRKIAMQYD